MKSSTLKENSARLKWPANFATFAPLLISQPASTIFPLSSYFLPPAMKLVQGNIFRSVRQEFCPRGRGGVGVSRPTPKGKVEGSGWVREVSRPTPDGDLQAHTWGVSGPHLGGGLQAHTQGGSPGPHLGGLQAQAQAQGCVTQHTLRQTPPADGYCCGWYTSYWNAFLLPLTLSTTFLTNFSVKILWYCDCSWLLLEPGLFNTH